jgi:type VI secretion system secreted protein Hcp
MADSFYVTIVGRRQGKFHGDGGGPGGKIKGLAFHYQVSSARDTATGQSTGRRQHSPVTFVKMWGASSPQLFEAAVSNEVLNSVLFEFIETNQAGEEYVFQTIKLTNASVASLKQDASAAYGGHDLQDLEEVSISFQSIEMENKTTQTVAADDWRGGNGGRLSSNGAVSGGSAAGAASGGSAGAAGGGAGAAGAAAGGAPSGGAAAAVAGGQEKFGGLTDVEFEAYKLASPRVLRSRIPGT